MSKLCYLAVLSQVVILGLLPVVRCQNPEITESILPEIKRVGVTGRLNCTVINQMDNPVSWIHKNTQTHISQDDKIVIDEKHNTVVNGWPKFQVDRSFIGQRVTYTIVINRLEPRDMGWYTCQILVRGSTDLPSKDGQMVVLIPPAIILSMTTHTVMVREHENVNLTCDASGYPTPNITWVRVNGGVLPNQMLRYQNRSLPINDVQAGDRGLFRCLADNNVRPPAYSDVILIVMFRPVSKAVQDSYGQAENRMYDITLECRIGGWPEPNLKWYKVLKGGNWHPLGNDDKHTINILLNHAAILTPYERWFQLVVRSVQANDFGDYICEGRNEYGQGIGTVNLFATSECQGPNCPPEQDTAGAPSLMTSLVCVWLCGLLSVFLR